MNQNTILPGADTGRDDCFSRESILEEDFCLEECLAAAEAGHPENPGRRIWRTIPPPSANPAPGRRIHVRRASWRRISAWRNALRRRKPETPAPRACWATAISTAGSGRRTPILLQAAVSTFVEDAQIVL